MTKSGKIYRMISTGTLLVLHEQKLSLNMTATEFRFFMVCTLLIIKKLPSSCCVNCSHNQSGIMMICCALAQVRIRKQKLLFRLYLFSTQSFLKPKFIGSLDACLVWQLHFDGHEYSEEHVNLTKTTRNLIYCTIKF